MEILLASPKVLDMEADNLGTWLYNCHVDHLIDAGMAAMYTVRS